MAPQRKSDDTANGNVPTEHSRGGVSTRDDRTDLGAPMLPGDPKEAVGPEDALGAGPKRGDYRERLGETHYQPHQVVAVEDAKEGEPRVKVVEQRPHTEQVGDDAARKGGVDTV